MRIYKTEVLPVVLYVCETWSLTLREEHTLRVFENRVLRRILGPKRDGVRGGWIKLPNIIMIKSSAVRWEGNIARMGKEEINVGYWWGLGPLGRTRRRRVDNGGMDWIDLAQDRSQWRALVNTVINLQVP
jgi:hypothetical protein